MFTVAGRVSLFYSTCLPDLWVSNRPRGRFHYHLHFTSEETEAQRRSNLLRLQSQYVMEPEYGLRRFWLDNPWS